MSEAPSASDIQRKLTLHERGHYALNGQTSWIALGIKIQEMQYAISPISLSPLLLSFVG